MNNFYLSLSILKSS